MTNEAAVAGEGGRLVEEADLASKSLQLIIVATQRECGSDGSFGRGLAAAAGRGASTAGGGTKRGGGLQRGLHAKLSAPQCKPESAR
jgi:hypothetical protein